MSLNSPHIYTKQVRPRNKFLHRAFSSEKKKVLQNKDIPFFAKQTWETVPYDCFAEVTLRLFIAWERIGWKILNDMFLPLCVDVVVTVLAITDRSVTLEAGTLRRVAGKQGFFFRRRTILKWAAKNIMKIRRTLLAALNEQSILIWENKYYSKSKKKSVGFFLEKNVSFCQTVTLETTLVH